MRNGAFILTGLYGLPIEDALKAISRFLPAGINLFSGNFDGPEDIQPLMKQIRRIYKIENGIEEPFFTMNQEGGKVVQLPWLSYNPSNAFLGFMDNEKFTEFVGLRTGYDLKKLGFDWHFAPDLDLSNDNNPVILERSYSHMADVVARHGAAYIRGVQRAGVSATAKHFPCHGAVMSDSHKFLAVDNRKMDALMNDMTPYVEAIRNKVASIMVAHILYPEIDPDFPSSISAKLYTFLRKALNFKGVAVTDSMDMQAVAKNYSPKEMAKLASGGGADIIDCVEIELSQELCENVEMKDPHASLERLNKIKMGYSLNFEPPSEIIDSMIMVNNEVRRHSWLLDPGVETTLIFLDQGDAESPAQEAFSNSREVIEKLGNRIPVKLLDLKAAKSNQAKQVILVGRNEHLNGRTKDIADLVRDRKGVFLSTGVPADVGLIPTEVTYIALRSARVESILGGIYRAFGFY